MHVLGLPPAFVLSQDQTLKLKSCCQLILDVRTSAHRPGVQPGQFLSVVLQVFIRKQETVQTVKLTLDHRTTDALPPCGDLSADPTSAIYRRLIHRMNQTAHISLQISSISKNVATKTRWMRPISNGAPSLPHHQFSASRQVAVHTVKVPPVAPAPRSESHAVGRGVLSPTNSTRNPFFHGKAFLSESVN